MRRDIEFQSEGITCRAWLYTPDRASRGSRSPTIVMAHGFSAVKEMRLDRFAQAFSEAGLASLVFDYRGTGASDGTPRQDLDPHAQIVDYRNAISFARALPEVDPGRIGIWGSSYSGAHVLVISAIDRRVKAVVSQVPLIDSIRTFTRLVGQATIGEFVRLTIEERERVYRGGAHTMFPVVGKEGEAVMFTPDAVEWFHHAARNAPTWKNECTLSSVERLLEYSPGRWIDRIAPTPLCLVAAETDFLPIDISREAFERAGEPKRLAVIPGGHFAPYEDPWFAMASREAVEWFMKWLAPAPAR